MSRRDTVMKYFDEQRDYMDERVKSGIELYRKGFCKVMFVDKEGNPVKDVAFKATQKSHDFNFGCNMFLLDEFETEEKNQKYREIFPTAFNYAIAPFYWDALEPEKGKPRYAADSPKIYRRPAPDLILDYCDQNNIRVKGHCLVYDAFAPEWMKTLDVSAIKKEIAAHLKEVADRYQDRIQDWDILNEMLCWSCYDLDRTTRFFREDDYVHYCFAEANRHPFTRKFINEAAGIWENFHFNRSYYYLLLKNLLSENVNFDCIGLQFHQFVPREQEAAYAKNRYNPMQIYDVLDTYGSLGKPLQISEITVASYNGDSEDMELQAELIENMYKIWFSHKAMDGVVYWNLVDGYTWAGNGKGALDMNAGENKFGGGLLYHDLSPKPAYKVLQKLLNEEWHTEELVHTNTETGIAQFKGFKGMYDIDFEYNGRKYTKKLHLDSRYDVTNKIVIE